MRRAWRWSSRRAGTSGTERLADPGDRPSPVGLRRLGRRGEVPQGLAPVVERSDGVAHPGRVHRLRRRSSRRPKGSSLAMPPARFELASRGLKGRRSGPLSYGGACILSKWPRVRRVLRR